MGDALAGLTPRSLWDHFSRIAAIPRPSKHEERIVRWVRELAQGQGFEVRSDAAGNLVLCVPASSGRESAPPLILQSHLDMVCEKNQEVEHDFMTDPIRPRIEGDWVSASGTTLGADNGIGVAAALAAAVDPQVVHGPLELLFTIDEETGLTGAQNLDGSILEGRVLLNMDSEEDGTLFVGCAGGGDCHLRLRVGQRAPAAGSRSYGLQARGLRGGHSGLNIIENRGNALKLLALTLGALLEAGLPVELAALEGGSKPNAIPREADARIFLPPDREADARDVVAAALDGYRDALRGIDDGLSVELIPSDANGAVLAAADRDRLIALLTALPHGVLGMSPEIPGLVETSCNVASVHRDGDRIEIVCSARSSVAARMSAVLASIRAAGRLAGADVRTRDAYPGWKPDMDSPVLGVLRGVYAEVWAREPEVTAVHAGLECGLLGERIPGLDMISFGPQIEGAHSPDERVHIPSVARFWEALTLALDRLSA